MLARAFRTVEMLIQDMRRHRPVQIYICDAGMARPLLMPHNPLRPHKGKMEGEYTLMSEKGMRTPASSMQMLCARRVLDQQDLLVAHLDQLLHRLVLHDLRMPRCPS